MTAVVDLKLTDSPFDAGSLDPIDHIAVVVENVAETVDWYRQMFRCTVDYQDDTWALLGFQNIKLALVVPSQHPAHLAFVAPAKVDAEHLTTHRDGTRSTYIKDPSGNAIELLAEHRLSRS